MDSAIDALYLEALQVPAGAGRDAFLDEACKDDAEMRRHLDAMLADDGAADAFFDGPATVSNPRVRFSISGEKPGDRIGHYKLLQQIGEGGFGIVFLADQMAPVKRRVALKILKPGMDTREVVARFEAERQALALMDHPNIARIFDGGATDSGRPYFVMELVKGIPLTKYCDDHQLSTRQRLDLFLDVLAAVQHAHQKGIIHRDLKPSNILVSPHDGRPVIRVIDFGIAKAISLELTDKTLFTAHGRMIGTPQYMSPEQAEINALDVDTRSDLYSLGVILYELLTGRTPLDAKVLREAAYAEIQRLIREEEPAKPSTCISTLGDALPGIARHRSTEPLKLGKQVRGDLDWIVMKALEKDRSRRYETANGFAADLRRHLENQPVVARPLGAGYVLSRFVRRHKFGFAAGAAVSVALLAGIAAATWGLLREAAARKTAESETTKAIAANKANKENLHLASMADFASAVKALDEDFEANRKDQRAIGFAGKSRWHEGVVLLTRSLERNLENSAAALRLYETLRSRHAEKRDWPLFTLRSAVSASFSPDGTRIATAGTDKAARVWDAATGRVIGEPMRHEGAVSSASFSPDGSKIFTVSNDKTARVWDAATSRVIGEPMRHEGAVSSASFSPDGSKIFTVSNSNDKIPRNNPDGSKSFDVRHHNTVRVWDAATSQVIGERMRHEGLVWSSFSPDGSKIFTVTRDGPVRVWDAVTGRVIGEPVRHEGLVRSSFSPDGTRIVTASSDGTARVWDAATGRVIGEPMRHEGLVWGASFSPDGSKIVTASYDKTARVWDAATSQVIGEPMRHEGAVSSANFSPDGTRIVTVSNDKTARVWDAATSQIIGEPMRHEGAVSSANFSPDGTRIVTVSRDGPARVWDAATSQVIGEPMRHEGDVSSASLSPDGSKIVTVSNDKTARVWDAATSQVIGEPMRHVRDVWSASFSPDGSKIFTVSNDNTARVWDAATSQVIGEPMRHEGDVWSASFSPDGSKIVTVSNDKTARVWDAATSQVIGEPMRHEGAVSSASFSPDGSKIFTVSHDNTARVWDAATSQVIGEPMRHEGAVSSANFSPDGSKIVTASSDGTARVWDAATGRVIGEPMRHEGAVSSANFSPDGSKIVTASSDGTARVWDAATGRVIGEPMRHEGAVSSANFSPDGTRIVTASSDGTARVWDAATGRVIGEPMRHEGAVSSANFSPDGSKIVTASSDGTARVWDAATGRVIGEPMRHEGAVGSANFSPHGTRIVTARYDQTARLWWILTKEESEVIPSITPEILTWARNISGLRFSEDGELHLVPDEQRIAAITSPALPAGPWADLANWVNTPAPQRTIDPKSKSTLRQIAERERDFNGDGNVESLESALRYDPTVPLARLLLAAALEKADAAKEAAERESSIPQRAAFLRRDDLDALARESGRMKNEELAALWVRAANHLFGLPPDTKIGVGPKVTTARDEAGKAARKALELVPGSPAAEELLKKL